MPILEQVLKNNPGKVKLVFKNFPLRNHKFAAKAAMAALAAHMQGKFWAFHDQLFLHYNGLNDQKIKEIVHNLSLDADKFEKQTASSTIFSKVRQDMQEGIRIGVKGTPTVFINGRRLRNRTVKDFQIFVDKEYAKVKKTENRTKP